MATKTLSRPFEISPEDRTERQSLIISRIESGPRGRVPINLRAWLHNPDFVDVVEPFGLYVSALAPITARQKEILVLVNARFWGAAYERYMHVNHARKAGISDEQIQKINDGISPDFADQLEQLTWEASVSLHRPGAMEEGLYQRCVEAMGHKGVSDLIGLAGLYTMIAMTLNFHDVRPPE